MGEEYFEIFGRYIPHEELSFQIKVDAEGWFPFIEQSCDLALHEALAKYGHIQDIPADGPGKVKVPFFLDKMDAEKVKKGEAPLFQSKLTHFNNGFCSLHFIASHGMVDGQRLVDLLNDVGKAARNEAVSPKLHDRSCMWPDEFLKEIEVSKMSPEMFPKMINKSFDYFNLRPDYFPGQTYSLQLIHFPEEVIKKTKELLSQYLEIGEYLSSADIISSVIWLLYCEATVPRTTGEGIEGNLKESIVNYFAEARQNGVPFIPVNYLGNAFLYLPIQYQEIKDNFEKDNLMKLLVNTALSFRRMITAMRSDPATATENLALGYTVVNHTSTIQELMKIPVAASMSSWSKMGLEDIDFGTGSPVFIGSPMIDPPLHNDATLIPGLKNGGIIATFYLLDNKKHVLFNSRILKECVPGAKFVFGVTEQNKEFNLNL